MKCIDCDDENIASRKRCKTCLDKYNYEKSHRSYLKRKEEGRLKRCGITICSICGKEMIKSHPEQLTHRKCISSLSITHKDYNIYPRSKTGKTLANEIVTRILGNIPVGYIVHHIDGNPFNNDISNFLVISAKDHGSLHQFLRKIRSTWLKDQSKKNENCWNTLIVQETTTWLEITGVNVIKIPEIGQSAAEPSVNLKIQEEGSETMYVLPVTDNAVGKDIVRTLTE